VSLKFNFILQNRSKKENGGNETHHSLFMLRLNVRAEQQLSVPHGSAEADECGRDPVHVVDLAGEVRVLVLELVHQLQGVFFIYKQARRTGHMNHFSLIGDSRNAHRNSLIINEAGDSPGGHLGILLAVVLDDLGADASGDIFDANGLADIFLSDVNIDFHFDFLSGLKLPIK